MAGESVSSGNSTRGAPVLNEIVSELRERAFLPPAVLWKPCNGQASVAFPRVTSTQTMSAPANGATEADAITPQAVTTSNATATPAAKLAAIMASWVLLMGSGSSLEAEIPKILARASAQLLDVDIATLGIAFSNTVGTTGNPLTVLTLQDGVTLHQRIALGVDTPSWIVLHTYALGNLRSDMLNSNSSVLVMRDVADVFPDGAGKTLSSSYQGDFNGTPVFKTTLVQDINGTSDHGSFILATQYALGGAMMMAPSTMRFNQGVNQRPADSWFHALIYGLIEVKDEGGVTIISDHV